MFVSYQWSIVIADKSNIRNNEFIEKPIPAHPSCRLDSLVALRNIYLLLFVIPDVTLVSNDNRPLKAHKHFETSLHHPPVDTATHIVKLHEGAFMSHAVSNYMIIYVEFFSKILKLQKSEILYLGLSVNLSKKF